MSKFFKIGGLIDPNKIFATDANGDVVQVTNDGGIGTIRIQGTLDNTATSFPQYPAVTGQTGTGRGSLGAILEGDSWYTIGEVTIGAETFTNDTLLVAKFNDPTNDTADWLKFSLGTYINNDTKDALQGTSGTPSNTNRFATQETTDTKLDKNTPIVGATKTKITYDSDGLVTSGADATTADIADSTDKRYVTDAQLVVIGNTSGTNTGDNATNTTSNAYADAKVEDTIVNGVTDKAPSQNAVYDALNGLSTTYVPYIGATSDVDLDTHSLNAKSLHVKGTGGAGHLGLKHQSANITASASESSIGADVSGNPVWKNDGNALDYLQLKSEKDANNGYVGRDSNGGLSVVDATITSTTASTLAFISSAKKLISATGSLLGTWFQTLTAKSTPVDADTLLTGDSANGYETKITTYTQLWTNYIKGKADATYNQIYTTSRYAKVDYVNGSDVTGLVQRQDKPFATLQSCYNAVVSASASASESWEIEVVGDKTFTLNALEITAQKNNITIIFKGNITNSIPNSETKGLICETGNYASSNWNIIFYNYTQTTNNGTWTGSWASSTIEFKTATIKNGKNASKCYGLTQTGTNNKLTADNLTWDITNDTSFTAYQYLTSLGTNFKMEIDTLNVIGAVTGSSVYRNFYYGAGAYIKINKVYWNPTNYTNLAYFAMNDSGGSADYIEINFFDQALDTNVKNNFYIFYQGVSTRCLRIETGNFLGNYASVVFTNGSIESLIVQNIVSNGRFLYALKCNLQINGQIKQYTASTTLTSLIYVQGGSKISGGKIIGNLTGVDPNSQGTIFVSKNGSDGTLGITIANCDVYNVGVPATSTVAVPCILHSGGTVGAQLFLYLQNCKMIQTIGNTNSNRSWINTNGFTTYVTAYILGDLYVNYGLTASNVNLTYQGNLNIEANLNA